MNKNLRYEVTLKSQSDLKKEFNLFKQMINNDTSLEYSNRFQYSMLKRLSECPFNKLTKADYDQIILYMNTISKRIFSVFDK